MEDTQAAPPAVVVAVGSCCVDLIGVVDHFPRPDDKTRTRHFQVECGGNCGNVAVALARLGVAARPLAKVGADAWGRFIVQQLRNEGVDTRSLVVKPGEEPTRVSSPFTYIIVDQATKTRTCLHTPLSEDFLDKEFFQPAQIEELLRDCRLLFLDSRHPRAARLVALEARKRAIPVLMDIEKVREGMFDLLPVVDSLNTSSHFPTMYFRERARGEKRTTASAAATDLTNGLVQLLSDYPRLRFIVTTLGEKGSVWIEKANAESCSELGDEGASTVEAFVDRNYDQWSRAESVAVTATTSLVRQMRLAQAQELSLRWQADFDFIFLIDQDEFPQLCDTNTNAKQSSASG